MKHLTVQLLREVCKTNKYIAVRFADGDSVGINCNVAFIKRMEQKPNVETQFVSYRKINFMEYISIKTPFFY